MKSSLDAIKGLVRGFAAFIAFFLYLVNGFSGKAFVGSIPMLLIVIAAGTVAFAPESMLSDPQGRVVWKLIVGAGLLGGVVCIWVALVGSTSPDNKFAFISAIGMLSLVIGFTRLLPDR